MSTRMDLRLVSISRIVDTCQPNGIERLFHEYGSNVSELPAIRSDRLIFQRNVVRLKSDSQIGLGGVCQLRSTSLRHDLRNLR